MGWERSRRRRVEQQKLKADKTRELSLAYSFRPPPLSFEPSNPANIPPVARVKRQNRKRRKAVSNKPRTPRTPADTLKARAEEMRLNPTRHELMFMEVLPANLVKRYQFQRVLAPYIVDFYFEDEMLAVEIDGFSHLSQAGYDRDRDKKLLTRHGTEVIRFLNSDVQSRKRYVLDHLERMLRASKARVAQSRFPRVVSAPSAKAGTPENRVE